MNIVRFFFPGSRKFLDIEKRLKTEASQAFFARIPEEERPITERWPS